jgi:hypothetical protein
VLRWPECIPTPPMEELASTVADVMYQYDHLDYDALPKASIILVNGCILY